MLPFAPQSNVPFYAGTRRPRGFSMIGFVGALTVFVLAVFVGFEVINKVPPTLHTPLMSASNAISGITIIGALIIAGDANATDAAHLLAGIAVALAAINVVGGFVVTHRMLSMFRRKD